MAPIPEEDREKPSQDLEDGGMDGLQMPDVVINAGSSDSEDDDGYPEGYMGYEPLPQDIEGVQFGESEEGQEDEDEEESADSSGAAQSSTEVDISQPRLEVRAENLHDVQREDFPNSSDLPNYMKVPDLPRPEKKDLLWNQPRQSEYPAMDGGHADKIRSAMAGFHLPSANIPDWAKTLTDDQWKQDIVTRLIPQSKDFVHSSNCDKTITGETIAMEAENSNSCSKSQKDARHCENEIETD